MKKTIIITGGSQGLGLKTSQFIAKDKAVSLVVTSRKKDKTDKAVALLKKENPDAHIKGLTLDLGDFESIKSFVENFKSLNLPPLYALVNNAGIQYVSETRYTKQGYEQTFGVNHLGHFLLTDLLLSDISENGKIINVASGVHKPGMTSAIPIPAYTSAEKLAFPDKKTHTKGLPHQGKERYSTSKLCNVLFTYKLSEKLQEEKRNIQVFAFDPGMMPGTGLADDYPAIMRFAWKNILPVQTLFGNRVNTPTQSGKLLAEWTLEEKSKKPTLYFYVGGEEESSEESYDKNLQNDLWDFSMTQIKDWVNH